MNLEYMHFKRSMTSMRDTEVA